MKSTFLGLSLAAILPAFAFASADGVWRTQSNADKAYLEVTVGPCEKDGKKTCGVITRAVTADGENPDYENLGKLMIMDMTSKDESSYTGGKIWDPERDKVFKSKMLREGNTLEVEGCVAFICDGQNWELVE